MLAEDEKRRSMSRENQLSPDDTQSLRRSSNGGARSGSYSVSGERAYATSLPGASGARQPTASQLNTASWRAGCTPSQADSRHSSKLGPPMHVNELQSQEISLKPDPVPSEGHFMNQVQPISNPQSSAQDPRHMHLYYSQNFEAPFLPVPTTAGAEDRSQAAAHSLPEYHLARTAHTRNNFDPQTLMSSTDSFT